MKVKEIYPSSARQNEGSSLLILKLVRVSAAMALTLATMVTPLGYKDINLNPMVTSAKAGRHKSGQSTIEQQREQLLIILFWANKFGYIDLKDKILVVPKSGRSAGSPNTIITKYELTKDGMTVPPDGRSAGSPHTVILKYQMKDGILTVPPEGRSAGSPNTIITKYELTKDGMTVPPDGRSAGSPHTVILKYQMKDGILTVPPEGRSAGSPNTIITKILIVPIVEFNKNPNKYINL